MKKKAVYLSLYVFNSASLAQPLAIDQLAADLSGYVIENAVITETHLKPSNHPDNMMNIAGYSMFRRDRVKRRGGGVAIYVRHSRLRSADV